MAKKKNKKEITRLRAQVEILKAHLGSNSVVKESISNPGVNNTKIGDGDHLIANYSDNTKFIINDLKTSIAVSLIFISTIVSLYLTKGNWYTLIRF